jgi:amino acid adenylation domain-containing protein
MPELLEELIHEGIELWEESGTLAVRANKGRLTPALQDRLKSHKDEILSALRARELPPLVAQPDPGETAPIPLSFSQERLWFIDQWAPGNPAYSMPGILKLTGYLDTGVLSRTLKEIFRRHAVLRTTFAATDGVPRQVIHPNVQVELPVIELPGCSPDSELVKQLISEMTLAPFDLGAGPLTRLRLVRGSRSEHLMLFAVHHVVWDGFSLAILMREIAALYEAFRRGLPSPLPELRVQYADYSRWQREFATHSRFEKQLDYWKAQLEGANTVLRLPCDRPRPAQPSFHGGREFVSIAAPLVESLRELAAEENATLFMSLLGAFAVLLHRYSEQEDILIGAPIANRPTPETQVMAGYFANDVVLRCDLSGNPSFRTLLRRVWNTSVGAYENQDVPFERVVEALRPERELGRTPLFQVLFALQNTSESQVVTESLALRLIETDRPAAMFDLVLSFWEHEQGLHGWIEFDSDIFDRGTASRIAKNLETLLQSAVDAPDSRVNDLQLLTAAEINQIVFDFNRTRPLQASPLLVHQTIAKVAAECPDAVAVICNGRRLTYAGMNGLANQVAHLLRATGSRHGELVGILMERSIEAVPSMIGTLKAGSAYLPIEPSFPDERIKNILQSSGVRRLIAGLDQTSRVWRLAAETGLIEHCIVHATRNDIEHLQLNGQTILPRLWPVEEFFQPTSWEPPVNCDPEDLAYVIYTSGSSGRPKGIMIAHAALRNLVEFMNREFEIGPADRVLSVASFCFDLSVYDILGVLAAGGVVHLASRDELADPAALVSILHGEPITIWNSAPAALEQILPFLPSGASFDAALRLCFLSGDWIPIKSPDDLRSRFPGVEVVALGGATEATIWSNLYRVREVSPHWSSIPYGKPISGARYYVLDKELRPCPIGVPGDLYIAGECLALGYLAEPELTAKAFVADPFSARSDERMYRTGDRARYFVDGNIEFLGRIDHQVKIRGFRVELGEIESAIRQHPAVRDVVVIMRKDPVTGDCLIAYVVAEDQDLTRDDLQAHLKARLPAYMIPSDHVLLDTLPMTQNGKVDRKNLPAPDRAGSATSTYVPPRTETEAILAEIWAGLFGRERIGVDEDFFVIGGNSMLAAQMVAQVRKRFGVPLSLRAMFSATNIGALAQVVEDAMIDLVSQLPEGEVEARLAEASKG